MFTAFVFTLSPSSTKRLIVDVIRFQPGETLTEILDSSAGTEQVRREEARLCTELQSCQTVITIYCVCCLPW